MAAVNRGSKGFVHLSMGLFWGGISTHLNIKVVSMVHEMTCIAVADRFGVAALRPLRMHLASKPPREALFAGNRKSFQPVTVLGLT